MKTVSRIIPLLLATLLSAGCEKEEAELTPSRPGKAAREWYEILRTDTISCESVFRSIAGFTLPANGTMVINSFLYHSVSQGDTLTLSGVAGWPLDAVSCSSIYLENHYFSTRWDECPSQTPQPGMIISGTHNAVYISSDYQGQGMSRHLDQLYYHTKRQAIQSLDCFRAALTLLDDHGPRLTDDYVTYNFGASLGGAVTLAVAREIELNPQIDGIVHLKKSFCNGGPYDQVAMFDYYLQTPDLRLTLPISFVCAIKNVFSYSLELKSRYSYSDCFTPQLISSGILDSLDTKNYTSTELDKMLYDAGLASLNAILSAQIMDSGTQLNRDIADELRKLDLSVGWTPTRPIMFSHTSTDTNVPIVCLESVQEKMKDNPNITYDLFSSGTHLNDAMRFYLNLLIDSYPLD